MAYADKKKGQKIQNEWIASKYDRINLTIPKGQKAVLQEYARMQGVSVNRLIWALIEEEYEKNPDLVRQVCENVFLQMEDGHFLSDDVNLQ